MVLIAIDQGEGESRLRGLSGRPVGILFGLGIKIKPQIFICPPKLRGQIFLRKKGPGGSCGGEPQMVAPFLIPIIGNLDSEN